MKTTWRRYIYTICLLFGVSILLITNMKICKIGNTSIKRNAKIIVNVENEEENFKQQRIITFNDEINVSTKNNNIVTPITNSHGPLDIKKNILKKTQSKIKYDTSNYNFSQAGVNKLEDLVMKSGGQPLRSIIVTTWRSGSTFLGDLINNAVPSTYYHCEPLMMFGTKQFRTPEEATKAVSVVKQMLNCNYQGLEDYFNFERNELHGFGHIFRQWRYCMSKNKVDLCYNAEVTSRLCKLFPFQNMKLVRIRLRIIEEILTDDTLNVRVILLIRDPRGVMHSRADRPFCKLSSDCCEPSLLCADMVSDYVAARRMLQQYPDRLMVTRFEELALQPNLTVLQIVKFLKLDEKLAFDFIQSHTNLELDGPHSTYKISRNVPFKWKTALHFNYVNEIQIKCREAMDLWGYKMAHNETHMRSDEFKPIEQYHNVFTTYMSY